MIDSKNRKSFRNEALSRLGGRNINLRIAIYTSEYKLSKDSRDLFYSVSIDNLHGLEIIY
jgi:hypothetical protein